MAENPMKTIYHYGGWGRNYGDLAIQASMMAMLQEKSSEGLNFIPIDLKQNIPLHADLIDIINMKGDMLLVGGGGLLMPGDGFRTRSGWQFNISLEDLSKLMVPLVVYGIGYNLFPGDEEVFDVPTFEHIKATYETAELFSVRDSGTRDWLKGNVGVDTDVIPDPAMFCPHAFSRPAGLAADHFYIGLNWAGDRGNQRFPPDGSARNVIKEVAHVLSAFLRVKGGGKVVYIPHVGIYDGAWADDFEACLGDNFYNVAEGIPWLFPESLVQVPLFVGIYAHMDIVVGMRGHSNIIPFGLGIPAIGFGNHMKNQFFAKSIGGTTIGNDCRGLLTALASDKPDQKEKRAQLKADIDAFNTKVLDVLHHS